MLTTNLLIDKLPSIEEIRLRRLASPLRRPYHLALGDITEFETILVEVRAGGRVGYGEATYVTGYTDEAIETAWGIACGFANLLATRPPEQAHVELLTHVGATAFTVTAFATALEMLAGHPRLRVTEPTRVPLLGILNAEEDPALTTELEALIERGFETIKIKVGFEVARDLAKVSRVQRANAGRCRLRIDANQGYSRADGARFAAALDPESIELFEQPCAKEDWDSAVAVAEVAAVPMMLDESIYGIDDIERAAELGAAQFIKLKLMKTGSLDGLADGLRAIRALGMTPVLGNGVATDVGNWMEACVARDLVNNATESNGFLKPRRSILTRPLRFEDGAIVLEPDFVPQLDERAVDAVTLVEEVVHA